MIAPTEMPVPFVLLVEDDDDERLLAERVLIKAGYVRIHHIGEGCSAKRFLEDCIEPGASRSLPDVVLMDLKLPGLHGQQILEWMSQKREFEKVLRYVLSSSGNPLDRKRAEEAHVTGYLMKPLKKEDIELISGKLSK